MPRDPRSWALRFHTQTGGATLTAQQPENNIVRTALEALAAVLGGTQSLHTNAFDEALALPTEHSATIALRTQQVIGYETGVTETRRPARRAPTSWSRSPTSSSGCAAELIEKIDGDGRRRARDRSRLLPGRDPRRGVPDPAGHRVGGAGGGGRQSLRRRRRDGRSSCSASPRRRRPTPGRAGARRCGRRATSGRSTRRWRACARRRGAPGNLLPPMKEALRARATLGEVSDALREVVRRVPPRDLTRWLPPSPRRTSRSRQCDPPRGRPRQRRPRSAGAPISRRRG